MSKKARGPKRTPEALTPVELEMMNVLWQRQAATINEILEHLPKGRQLAYTSVSTIVRILEQKGFVRSRKEGRGHRYEPLISKDAFQEKAVKHLIHDVFDDTPATLVKQLLTSDALSEKELLELRALLDRKDS